MSVFDWLHDQSFRYKQAIPLVLASHTIRQCNVLTDTIGTKSSRSQPQLVVVFFFCSQNDALVFGMKNIPELSRLPLTTKVLTVTIDNYSVNLDKTLRERGDLIGEKMIINHTLFFH